MLVQYTTWVYYPGGGQAADREVDVLHRASNQGAPMYTDATGGTPLANPLTTDNDGMITFFAPPGDYVVVLGGESYPVPLDASVTQPVRPTPRLHERTADEVFTVPSGTMWLREDLGQVRMSDGQEGPPLRIGPYGNLPVIRASGVHMIPPQGPSGTVTMPADRLFVLPIWPGRACEIIRLNIQVATADAGSSVRVGLYRSLEALPTDLVAEFGTIPTDTTGIQTITDLSQELRPRLSFLAIVRQGGVGTVSLTCRTTWEPIISDEFPPELAQNKTAYTLDGVTGALPATFGPVTGAGQGPAVGVRLL